MHPAQIIELSAAKAVSMGDEWFEFSKADHFWMQWRFEIFHRAVSDTLASGGSYLDIGCGAGVFRKQVEDAFSVDVFGCDLNSFALSRASAGRGKLYLYDIFEENPELLHRFDGAFFMDVIEHLDDDREFLHAGIKHVKPGGLVVVNVPAVQLLFSRYDTEAGHKRRYSKQQLGRVLENVGLQQIRVFPWGFSMLPVLALRKLYLACLRDSKQVIASGFEPPSRLADFFLRTLMKCELELFTSPPSGTSLLAVGKVSSDG